MRDITAARTNCPKPRVVWMLPPFRSYPAAPVHYGSYGISFQYVFFLAC